MSPKTILDTKSKFLDLLGCVFDDKTLQNIWDKHFARDRIQEKINYMDKLRKSILTVQEEFISNVSEMKKQIEKSQTVNRQKSEAVRLVGLAEECLKEWTRQLDVCDAALEWLYKYGFYNHVFYGGDDFNTIFNKLFLDKVGRIERKEIILDATFPAIQYFIGKPIQVLPKFVIGNSGDGPGELCRPWGVSTDFMSRILVADRSNHRIQVFSESGEFLLTLGEHGSKPGQLWCPSGVAVDKDGRIIVADKDNHRIQIFTMNGAFVSTFGKKGTSPGEFHYPWDVAANESREIAVSDSKNHRIQLFNRKGRLLKIFGFSGFNLPDINLLNMPKGLAFRPDGKLLVTDFNNHRVLLLDKNFQLLRVYGKHGSDPGSFFRPQGVACYQNGTFAVSDCKNYRIQILDFEGKVQECFGRKGSEKGELDCPQGLAYQLNGDLLVVDFGNNRIQVF